ncbi:hypothetical protein [Methylobacterium brachiatum]|uniref:hypothetical protein n=1 Tax=Methylobacterium brachiatum TaxID=269660 RepID=UPI0008E81E6A|nr:hypothetical protein [Methylobacterium brachiatum]SFI05447.1 hypothetical protein SAMN02799642_00560 [Methylobacterium brachiatum]
MTYRTKPRPLLTAFALAAMASTAAAPAAAAIDHVSTFYAYTAPLPEAPPAPSHIVMFAAGLVIAGTAAALVPLTRIARGNAALAEVPTPTDAAGPIYCPRSRRWRDPVTGRLVKAPNV